MNNKPLNKVFNFDNTYPQLPVSFYSKLNPAVTENPELFLLNTALIQELGVNKVTDADLARILSGSKLPDNSEPLSQAYAGHQFGHFTMLGDGRAILLGEHITNEGERFDIQLKGSGKTPYSRGGDGKATLKSMLREYLISEAMFYLGVPTSRSLAVVKTNEPVYRETINTGAVLTRVMTSHIRVGTFEYARYFGKTEDLQTLTNYTINRHFPETLNNENPALSLLERVMNIQIDLVVNWMRVGFIHGVMNTDNTSICGETFDYGPCAFMSSYNPETVYSSIDHFGRYSFGNQPQILKWNLAKLAEALLPLIHPDEDKAVSLAVEIINQFDSIFNAKYYSLMLSKIGIDEPHEEDSELVDELLNIMQTYKADYTNTFTSLRIEGFPQNNTGFKNAILPWKEKWEKRLSKTGRGIEHAKSIMKKNNPVLIPRNQHVEEAIENADKGKLSTLNTLLETLQKPYEYRVKFKNLLFTDPDFDKTYKTFCGT